MSEMNRRIFLGAAASGLAAASTGLSQQASDKIVVGVMGTGGRGKSVASTFQNQPNVEVAYVCDVDQGRAEQAAGIIQKISNKTPKIVGDYRRILDDKSVDVLVCCTCNHWHAPATIAAVGAGKHVYVEKPCSHNPAEGEMMVAAARKHKKHVQMGNQRRSWPTMLDAIEQVRKGVIGRAYLAEAWYQNNRPTIGKGEAVETPKGLDYAMWQGPAPAKPFKSNYLHYNWHWFWHWGNGELGNNGVHIIDLCRWALDTNYPIRVTSSGNRYRFDDDQETPDTHVVSFEFDGRKQITWTGLSCSKQPGRNYHTLIHGEDGTMEISDTSFVVYDVKGVAKATTKMVTGDNLHVNNLLAAVRNNGRLNSEIEEAHKTTLLCHLGNIAHRTGRSLKTDPKNGRILGDQDAMKMWTREYQKGFEPQV